MIDGVEKKIENLEKVSAASDSTNIDSELHKRQIENLIGAINGENKLVVDACEGKKAVKIIEEIYKSSKNV
jgi:hypothetical protein